jgi:hypothetical protein
MKNLASLPVSSRFARQLVLVVTATCIATALPAQTATETPPAAPVMVPAPVDAGGTPGEPNNNGNNRRANFNPAEMQTRMLAALRTQLDVPDDAEWALISERVTKVFEMRRNQLISGLAGGRLAGRFGGQVDPEQDALRTAISDKLPDTEIKARLARLRDARKQNETKLDQAREELRAVLSVRQEAVLVMAGLLN